MSKDLYQYTSKNSAKIVAGDFGKILIIVISKILIYWKFNNPSNAC